MFELRPYRTHENQLSYNPFREMEEFERRFFGEPFFRSGDLDLDGETLTVSAERHSAHEEKSEQDKYVRVERSYGKYSRQFDVSGVDVEHIKAKYDNGVLALTLPKRQQSVPQAKRLEIE